LITATITQGLFFADSIDFEEKPLP
jgi:hypothetical protein